MPRHTYITTVTAIFHSAKCKKRNINNLPVVITISTVNICDRLKTNKTNGTYGHTTHTKQILQHNIKK